MEKLAAALGVVMGLLGLLQIGMKAVPDEGKTAVARCIGIAVVGLAVFLLATLFAFVGDPSSRFVGPFVAMGWIGGAVSFIGAWICGIVFIALAVRKPG